MPTNTFKYFIENYVGNFIQSYIPYISKTKTIEQITVQCLLSSLKVSPKIIALIIIFL